MIPQNPFEKRMFWALVILKLFVGALFSSGYRDDIFLPFTSHFVENLDNTWQYFFEVDKSVAFPYPPLMLLIFTPGAFLIGLLKITSPFLINLIFTIPTLIADLLIYRTLRKYMGKYSKEVLIYYFASPIILYACFIHGQLDLIPTSLLVLSTYYLSKNRLAQSMILFGLSFTAKFHTVMAAPFFLIYVYKRNKHNKLSYLDILKIILIPVAIHFILTAPYFISEGYQFFVHQNREQSLVFEAYQRIGELHILIVPSILSCLAARFLLYPKINADLLFSFLGLLFATFVLFVRPTPGWYVWAYPYYVGLLLKSELKRKYLNAMFGLLVVAYLVYFLVFYTHPFVERAGMIFLGSVVNLDWAYTSLQKDLSFTILEISLIFVIYNIYQFGIKSNSIYKLRHRAFSLGISGDSAAGKTTLLEDIRKILGAGNVVLLEGDAEHKWERGDKKWDEFTHLNPRANFLYKQAQHLEILKRGQSTKRGEYDHSTGKFTELKKVDPGHFIALSGLHAFYLPKLRKLLDLKIFLDPDERIRKEWKVTRDTKERGHDKEKVEKQIEDRLSDAKKYILPQKEYSDLVISYGLSEEQKHCLKIECSASIDLEVLNSYLDGMENCHYQHDFSEDLNKQVLVFFERPSVADLELLAGELIPNRRDIVDREIVWEPGFRGLVQLFVLLEISEKMKG